MDEGCSSVISHCSELEIVGNNQLDGNLISRCRPVFAVGPHGESILLEDIDLATGRLGLLRDGKRRDVVCLGHVYGGMNLYGALDDRTAANVSAISLTCEQKGLSVDGHIGFSYEWDEGYAFYGEVVAHVAIVWRMFV